MNVGIATREGYSVVAVLAFIRGDHNGGIFGGSLHSFLHHAFAVGAAVVAPWKWTVFDCLLPILSPSVAIFQMINLALSHECESGLIASLLSLLSTFVPAARIIYIMWYEYMNL